MKTLKQFIRIFAIIVILFNFITCDLFNEDDINTKTGVEPLMKTQWSQYSPYNDLFPIASEGYTLPVDNAGRTLTDCSNTALAQILYFHKHPKQGIGHSTKLLPMHSYGQIEDVFVNLEVPFDWDNILNEYPNASSGTKQQRHAIATLMLYTAAARGASGNTYTSLVFCLIQTTKIESSILYA